MPNPVHPINPLLSEKEAARLLGVSHYWLQKVRSQRRPGPVVTYIGGAVRYRLSNLERYITERSSKGSDETRSGNLRSIAVNHVTGTSPVRNGRP